MDPTADMPDEQGRGEDAALLGRSAKAFGKGALAAYWILCLGVIGFGLTQMKWPQLGIAAPSAPVPSVRTVVSSKPVAAPAARARPPARPAQPARPIVVQAPDPAGPASWWPWVGGGGLCLIGGTVLAWLGRSRRGSRQLGRFSGRRHRVVPMQRGLRRRWRS
jgi:hypothetical protein